MFKRRRKDAWHPECRAQVMPRSRSKLNMIKYACISCAPRETLLDKGNVAEIGNVVDRHALGPQWSAQRNLLYLRTTFDSPGQVLYWSLPFVAVAQGNTANECLGRSDPIGPS